MAEWPNLPDMVAVCSKCGAANPDDADYCMKCAAPLRTVREDSALTIAEQVTGHTYGRRHTDRWIAPQWVLILLLTVVPSAFLSIYGIAWSLYQAYVNDFFALSSQWIYYFEIYGIPALEIIFAILAALLVIRLVSRLNDHSEREGRLMQDFVRYVRASAAPEQQSKITDELILASQSYGRMNIFEKKLDAKRWGLMVAALYVMNAAVMLALYRIPLTFDYSMYAHSAFYSLMSIGIGVISALTSVVLIFLAIHLMRTLIVHQRRWREFVRSAYELLGMIGKKVPARYLPEAPKERSVVRYTLFTAVTFGLYGFYWLYTLIDDPNKHFEMQAGAEEALFAAIKGY